MIITLTAYEKSLLLDAARFAIGVKLGVATGRPPKPTPLSDALKTHCGAFVTLTKDDILRGCVGHIIADERLYDTVTDAACLAAFNDSRFDPVTKAEFDDLTIEISVMTPPKAVQTIDEIKLGRHGIIMRKKGRRALFLPKVAEEWEWDIDMTLTQLSLKAGLGKNEWKEGASFEVFEAIVFSEGGV